MVEMPVREQDEAAREPLPLQPLEHGLPIAGIDDGARAALIVMNQIRIDRKRATGQGDQLHQNLLLLSKRMVNGPSLTSETCISARNTPVCTGSSAPRRAAHASYSARASSGGAASV